MKAKSRTVTSNQLGPHENLLDVVNKNKQATFLKPYSQNSIEVFQKITDWVSLAKDKDIILDMCCGVAESSYHIALSNPNELVIGIDKSEDRINRENLFKNKLPENLLIVRADLLDLWRMFLENKSSFKIKKQYILYPNPYPKQKHLKLRWHGSPIFPSIMNLAVPIEIRSNWKLYLDEFLIASKEYGYNSEKRIEEYNPEILITPFERKFSDSGQQLYCVSLNPGAEGG